MNEDFRMEQGYKEAAYGDSLADIQQRHLVGCLSVSLLHLV